MRNEYRVPRSLLLLAVAFLVVAGCGSPDTPVAPGTTSSESAEKPEDVTTDSQLLILCGSSFRRPMEKLVEMYQEETGKELALSFGGSEDHWPHVELKAKGDFYVTHSPFMQKTADADSLLREVPVGFNAPVLVVAKGNPKKVESIEGLTAEGLRVVLPNPEYSTCGEMVFALLKEKEILDDVLKNVGNAQKRSHQEIGNAISVGARDAGIMWNGVANGYLDKLDIVPAPYEYDEEIAVSVMGLSYTKHEADVQAFLDFVEKHGQEVFAAFGYVK